MLNPRQPPDDVGLPLKPEKSDHGRVADRGLAGVIRSFYKAHQISVSDRPGRARFVLQVNASKGI